MDHTSVRAVTVIVSSDVHNEIHRQRYFKANSIVTNLYFIKKTSVFPVFTHGYVLTLSMQAEIFFMGMLV